MIDRTSLLASQYRNVTDDEVGQLHIGHLAAVIRDFAAATLALERIKAFEPTQGGVEPHTQIAVFAKEQARAALAASPASLSGGAEEGFCLGAFVEKKSGSSWRGKIVGSYSTGLTPVGWAVESSTETGSVQIYPEKALRLASSPEAPANRQEAGEEFNPNASVGRVTITPEHNEALYRALLDSSTEENWPLVQREDGSFAHVHPSTLTSPKDVKGDER